MSNIWPDVSFVERFLTGNTFPVIYMMYIKDWGAGS